MATTQYFISSVSIVNTRPAHKGQGVIGFIKRILGLETVTPVRSTGKGSDRKHLTNHEAYSVLINLPKETRILVI